MVVAADVSERDQMRTAVEQAQERFGAIHGVIHAAGIAGGGMIQLKNRQAAMDVITPKVKGALVLQEVLSSDRLDFFVVCSSLASLLGGFGQVDYCAANDFLDAFIENRNLRNGELSVAISWDTWQEVGMAVNAEMPKELEARRQEALRLGMETPEATQAFHRILQSTLSQVIVSTQDFELRSQQMTRAGMLELEQAATNGRAGLPQHARPHLSTAYAAPRNETEAKIVEIWETLLGTAPIGINDNLFDLGGHSLLATQIVSRVRPAFKVDVPLGRLFETPTVAGLALAVIAERTAQADGAGLAETVAALEQLSEEEVEALLAAEGKKKGQI
jgi:NAD(P)-dependent dehydrogenase (short-subunit alcohol dehydrogenase family)